MNVKAAEAYLFAYRKGKPNDPAVEKALRYAQADPELARRLEQQVEFDIQLSRAVQAIAPRPGLRQRLTGEGAAKTVQRPQISGPAIMAAVCGLVVIVGLLVVFAMEKYSHFPGQEAVGRIVESASRLSGLELEPISLPVGELVDWFYMRGFESYHVPHGLAALPAVGSRLFKQDGSPIAQVAINTTHSPVLYVFAAADFGVEVPDNGEWHLFPVEDWEVALRRDHKVCTVLTFRGTAGEMRELLRMLPQP